ncbi:MAG: class B sortase [Candidatus Merdivicinus sp.]|jgi:SrtB family sortase
MTLSHMQEEQLLRSIRILASKKRQLSVAEIGTGGLFAQVFASVPGGAEKVLRSGQILFDLNGMTRLAGVRPALCRKFGMNRKETAVALAVSVMNRDKTAIGIGVSGPADGSEPIWAAIAIQNGRTRWIAVEEIRPAEGGNVLIQREQTVALLINLLDGYLSNDQRILDTFQSAKKWKSCYRQPFLIRLIQFFLPWKGDSASDVVVKVLLIAALAVGGWAASQLSGDLIQTYESTQVLERAVQTMEQPPSSEQITNLPEGYLDKFASAYAINSEIVGWLNIPNTNMNLPVLQHEDNDYYLNHNFEGDYDPNGVPFMDFRNNVQELDNNTLIYGHNWESGQMFHSLLLYKDVEFYKQNPVITFDTVYEESQWKVIACFEAVTDANIGEVFNYFNFVRTSDPERVQWYLDEVMARSYFTTTVDVNTDDRLLTLQTCANDRYNRKICLVARKVRPGESAEVDVSGAAENPNRVKPVIY